MADNRSMLALKLVLNKLLLTVSGLPTSKTWPNGTKQPPIVEAAEAASMALRERT